MLITIILNGLVSLSFGFTTNIVYAFTTRFLTGLVNGKCPYDVTIAKNNSYYRKIPKFSDARKQSCNLPKIQQRG